MPDPAIVKATADELYKGILEGWKADPGKIKFGSQEQRLLIGLRYNTFVTSIFKHHHSSLAMARELIGPDGKLRSFTEFKKAVMDKVDPKYNKKWLETEYNTSVAAGQQARKWMTYVSRGGSITYVAVLDSRTRPHHAAMHGATYPVDHVFWHNNFPPNDWNCRCTTRWAGTEADIVQPKTFEDIPQEFQNNVGKSGQVFLDSLPYFTVDKQFANRAADLFGYATPVDLAKYDANVKLYNQLLDDPKFKIEFVDNLTGGFVVAPVKGTGAGAGANIKASKILASRGDAIILNEISNVPNAINPDLIVDGLKMEVKTIHAGTAGAVDRALRYANRQAETVVLHIESSISDADLKRAIRSRIHRTDIQRVIILKDGEIIDLKRDRIIRGEFW